MGFLVDMIDVGYGDSFLLTLDNDSNGETYVLIDGGRSGSADIVIDHLRRYTNGFLSLVIATHIDNDHIGGLKKVVEEFRIDSFVLNYPSNSKAWLKLKEVHEAAGKNTAPSGIILESIQTATDLLDVLKKKRVNVREAYQGHGWQCGHDIYLKVLSPTMEAHQTAWAANELKNVNRSIILESRYPSLFSVLSESAAPETTAVNDTGIVIELSYKTKPYALFAADVGAARLKEVTQGNSYRFLKISHHGSKTGLDEELVSRFSNGEAYLSVGDNPYGHPAIEVLDLLRQVKTKTYCTRRTKFCKEACLYPGFGTICHSKDKTRIGLTSVDWTKCLNNK